jgi:hypothetical protein
MVWPSAALRRVAGRAQRARPANVPQFLGRPGEVCGAASGADTLIVVRTGA